MEALGSRLGLPTFLGSKETHEVKKETFSIKSPPRTSSAEHVLLVCPILPQPPPSMSILTNPRYTNPSVGDQDETQSSQTQTVDMYLTVSVNCVASDHHDQTLEHHHQRYTTKTSATAMRQTIKSTTSLLHTFDTLSQSSKHPELKYSNFLKSRYPKRK